MDFRNLRKKDKDKIQKLFGDDYFDQDLNYADNKRNIYKLRLRGYIARAGICNTGYFKAKKIWISKTSDQHS